MNRGLIVMSTVGKRGRPLGYKLNESTKIAIRQSKIGQKHSQETKDKISKSLLSYFRRKNPLSTEMINSYCNCNKEFSEGLMDWFDEVREFIDSSEDILTYRAIYNIERQERSIGPDIENISHNITPELLVMFKQHCEAVGITMDSFYDSIEG